MHGLLICNIKQLKDNVKLLIDKIQGLIEEIIKHI